jgi:uncharacterized protein YqeY
MILQSVNEAIKNGMKSGLKSEVLSLKSLKSALEKNSFEKSPKKDLDVVVGYRNMLVKSLDQYVGKFDKLKEIEVEIKLVERFLPKQLSEYEVLVMVSEVKAGLGEKANVGSMMKILKQKTQGSFNGKRLSELVRESLQ